MLFSEVKLRMEREEKVLELCSTITEELTRANGKMTEDMVKVSKNIVT